MLIEIICINTNIQNFIFKITFQEGYPRHNICLYFYAKYKRNDEFLSDSIKCHVSLQHANALLQTAKSKGAV